MNFTKGKWKVTYFDSTISAVRNGITVKEPEYLGVGVFNNPKGSPEEDKSTRMICKITPMCMEDSEDKANATIISFASEFFKSLTKIVKEHDAIKFRQNNPELDTAIKRAANLLKRVNKS